MTDTRVNQRQTLIAAALSIVGAVCVCVAAFSSGDEYDTLLFGIGVVAMFSATVFMLLAVRNGRRPRQS